MNCSSLEQGNPSMSRSLLLIVCDFLLLSILALARFDIPKDAQIPTDGQKIVAKEIVERKAMARIMMKWWPNWKPPMRLCKVI